MATKLARCVCTYARTITLRSSLQPTSQAWKNNCYPAAFAVQSMRWRSDSLTFNEPSKGDYRYTTSHEWVLLEGTKATVGISNYAQDKLGDVVFVELPEVGAELEKEDQIGVLESVKAAADVYSPISGTVLEVNTALEEDPELINKEPYENGWIAKLEAKDTSELDSLMTSDQYETYLSKSEV